MTTPTRAHTIVGESARCSVSTPIALTSPMKVAMRRVAGEEAEGLWRQLSQGTWSVIDQFDESGRRLVLAVRVGSLPARPWHRLSARERGIISAVAAGKSNRMIAESLGIAVSTVAGHLRAARRKLDGVRRIDLVREWTETSPTK